jgi:hypothetical protein
MKSCTSLLVALAWALTAGHGLAQEKYTFKLKELGQGDSSQVERKEVMASKASIRPEKELVPKTFEFGFTKHFSYTDTILERPEGSPVPTKVKRVFEKVVVDSQLPGGLASKSDTAQTLSGKTLLIEKKGDKYEYRIEGGEVLDKITNDLNDEFNKQEQDKQTKALLPRGPVAVNETWKIEAKDFLGDETKGMFQDVKPEGTAKLVKVYKKEGRLYGVIETVLDLQSKFQSKLDVKGANNPPPMETKGTLKLTFDGCIDGSFAERSFNVKMEMNGTMNMPQGGPVYSSTIASQDYTLKELPRK